MCIGVHTIIYVEHLDSVDICIYFVIYVYIFIMFIIYLMFYTFTFYIVCNFKHKKGKRKPKVSKKTGQRGQNSEQRT